MFASNSWSPSKRKAYSSSPIRSEEDLYSPQSPGKSSFPASRHDSSLLHNLSRNLYIRYFLSLLLGLFLGRTIFAPVNDVNYHLPSLPYHHHSQTSALASQRARWSNSTLGTAAIIT